METTKQHNSKLTGDIEECPPYLFNEKAFEEFSKSADRYTLEQILTRAINAMKYAGYNYDGSKYENFDKSIVDSTGVSDTLYISVNELESLLGYLAK